MKKYRYYAHKGLRRKAEPLGQFEGTEIRSEDFDSIEDYCEAIAARVYQLIDDDGGTENDDSN